MLHRDGGLSSAIEYDDGVHLGSSYLLLNGTVPYRDITFLQPPGISVLMLPLAAIGKWLGLPVGFALARLATCAAAAGTTVLLGRLVARHADRARGLVAAVLYAGAMPGIVAGSTLLLEPWLSLFVVLSLNLVVDGAVSTGRLAVAGAIGGLGATVKVWGIVVVLTLLGWLCLRQRFRDARSYALGAAVGVTVVCLPFFVLAPSAMIRDVVTTQATRPPSGIQGWWNRWSDALSIAHLTGGHAIDLATALITVAICICVLRAARSSSLGRIAVALLLGSAVLFAVAGPYYTHYGEYMEPFLAIVVAISLPDSAVQAQRPQAAVLLPGVRLPAMLLIVVTFIFSGLQVTNALWRARPAAVRSAALHRMLGPARCVVSDQMTLLILADAPLRCSWLDPRGEALTMLNGRKPPHFYPKGFRAITAWQREWLQRLSRADAVISTGPPCSIDEWTPQVCNYVVQHFRLVGFAGAASPQLKPVGVWQRGTTP